MPAARVDVRQAPPADRDPTIHDAFASLEAGETPELLDNHEPASTVESQSRQRSNIFGKTRLRAEGEPGRMSTETRDEHDPEANPVADHVHENSWSANLEGPEYADDRGRVVEQAVSAVEHTALGSHVNLVTHEAHGHPETYLYDVLDAEYGERAEWEYVDQCGCGGHVVRVHV